MRATPDHERTIEMTGCSRENAKKIAVGLGLVPSVYTERNETMDEKQDDLTKRARIARIEAAALAVLPTVWGSTGATDEKAVEIAINIGRRFADAMEQEEGGA